MKLLINASNLHQGGGVQVATSFLYELFKKKLNGKFCFYVSTVVDTSLRAIGVNIPHSDNYQVFDVIGLHALEPRISRKFIGFHAVFTIFGPLYVSIKIPNHIIGFAQLWILQPINEISEKYTLYQRLRTRLKFLIQWGFFRYQASRLVVEMPHVKRKLVEAKGYSAKKIDVVENCYSSIYLDISCWAPLGFKISSTKNCVRLCYVSRAYPHKNIKILLDVANILRKCTKLDFEFYVTLSDEEWSGFSDDFRNVIRNVGPLSVAQCPTFYQLMDGVVFTSLLECFSATPLEAMVMQIPLFASDRDFVRDVCENYAIYVDPLSPNDIAKKIIDWFLLTSDMEKKSFIGAAYARALNSPNSQSRAEKYLHIIENI